MLANLTAAPTSQSRSAPTFLLASRTTSAPGTTPPSPRPPKITFNSRLLQRPAPRNMADARSTGPTPIPLAVCPTYQVSAAPADATFRATDDLRLLIIIAARREPGRSELAGVPHVGWRRPGPRTVRWPIRLHNAESVLTAAPRAGGRVCVTTVRYDLAVNLSVFEQFPIIETEQLRLRELVDEDAPALFELFRHEEVTRCYEGLTRWRIRAAPLWARADLGSIASRQR